jgi:hypothetical protein
MSQLSSRRRFLTLASLAIPAAFTKLQAQVAGSVKDKAEPKQGTVPESFPAHPPQLAREMVTVSHFNLNRVKELVTARPALARAAWDWGFGDWETALGAASHMGNRPIAEYLIANGARPSLFSAAMLGQMDVVKAFVAAQPGVQCIAGPHSISLLAHAKAGGDAARPVFEFLKTLGDADQPAEAALSAEERAAILGTYIFGSGPSEQVDVGVEQGHLTWTRKGTMGRWLFHIGDRVFYPGGAAAVRIAFKLQADSRVMTVSDADFVLTAPRREG